MNIPRILIGVPTMEMARAAVFYDYLHMMEKPHGTAITFSHGQSPAENRNVIIKQALEGNFTHIFFIDDDVLIPPHSLHQLVARKKDIVSGLYLQRRFPHAPIAFNVALNDGRCRYKFLNSGETGLVEVVNFGLGCALIHTDVFRKMEEPWIRIGQLNKQEWNDDIEFFNRAREQYGYQLFLDLDVRCGHAASISVWPDYNVEQGVWLTRYDTQSPVGHAAFYAATPKQIYPNDEFEKMLEANKNKVIKDLSDGKY